MQGALDEFLVDKLYKNINLIDVGLFNALLPKKNSRDSNSCQLICPACWSHSAYHYFGSPSIACNICKKHTPLVYALKLVNDLSHESAAISLCSSIKLKIPEHLLKNTAKRAHHSKPIHKEKLEIKIVSVYQLLRDNLISHNNLVNELVKVGFTQELMKKAPLGYFEPSLENNSYQELVFDNAINGVAVPWFITKGKIFLWGYTGSLLKSAYTPFPTMKHFPPCHFYHPINKSNDFIIVVRDPILASLLIARKIPACAVGDENALNVCARLFSKYVGTIYVLTSQKDDFSEAIKKYNKNTLFVDADSTITLGPYFGAYYKRFVEWPVARLRDARSHSKAKAVYGLSDMLKQGVRFEEAVLKINDKFNLNIRF